MKAVAFGRVGVSGLLRLGLCLLALTAGVATMLLVPHSADPPTTYGSSSGFAHAAGVVAGLSLLAAGLAMTIVRRRGWLGIVVLLAGAAWFAPDWVGWEDAAPLLRSIAMVIAPFLAPLLLHLALATPGGRLASRPARAVVVAFYRRGCGRQRRPGSLARSVPRPVLLEQLH